EMKFRSRRNETPPETIKRIVREQLDEVNRQIGPRARRSGEQIHRIRVAFKRIRSVLCLIRSEVGSDFVEQEDVIYRDCGRELAGARDASVQCNSLNKLANRFPSRLRQSDRKQLRKVLKEPARARKPELDRAFAVLAERLAAARQRVEAWPLSNQEFSSF